MCIFNDVVYCIFGIEDCCFFWNDFFGYGLDGIKDVKVEEYGVVFGDFKFEE